MSTKPIKRRAPRKVASQPLTASLQTVPATTGWYPGADDTLKQWVIYAGDKPKEAYDRLVEQGARAWHEAGQDHLYHECGATRLLWTKVEESYRDHFRTMFRAALAAIGITQPKS